MSVRSKAVISLAVIICSAMAIAQTGTTLSGTVPDWQEGEAEVVLLSPRDLPPPFVRPADAPTIGAIAADGAFTLTVPEEFPAEEFVPVAEFLDPGCSNATLEPPDAVYFPIAYGVYHEDGSLIGEIFRGSEGARRGPLPGEFTTLPGYADQPFTLRGTCANPRRPVIEDYDFSVEAGWHEIVQTFSEHPEQQGMRLDRWRNEPVPEEAVWILIRPPR